MKKIIILSAIFVLFSSLLFSQNVLNEGELQNFYVKQNKLISQALGNKEYDEAVKLLNECITLFERLPQDLKKQYSGAEPGIYYNLACAYSLKKDKVSALDAFTTAVDKGYRNYSHTKTDTDLDFIRNEKSFKAAMKSIREIGDYPYVLSKAAKYQSDKDAPGLSFFYLDSSDVELSKVRKYFNLDSIAGNGDEISQIKNLLFWAHNRINWDGNFYYKGPRNAIDISKFFDSEKQGVNCRMMATFLNECYLAMGFKSRFVTCMPKWEDDPDCHVINCVYSKTLNKWIWVDASFNAYVSDEKGNMLSIAEVRERIVKKKPLFINSEANVNNQRPEKKEHYLDYYMAKNLYWFGCSQFFGYNTESRKSGEYLNKYINLCPDGFEAKEKGSIKETVSYNPDKFWQVPQ